MRIEKELQARSGGACELCGTPTECSPYDVPPNSRGELDDTIMVCTSCQDQVDGKTELNPKHWRGLGDRMWSEVPGVQVMAWRMLNRLQTESWAQDLLDSMYLDDDTLAWAKEGMPDPDALVHVDSNGNVLQAGDTVTLIQDLKVKGANFTAKRGTAVRRISLDANNPEYIEGKVDGQHIVILTKYVKKAK